MITRKERPTRKYYIIFQHQLLYIGIASNRCESSREFLRAVLIVKLGRHVGVKALCGCAHLGLVNSDKCSNTGMLYYLYMPLNRAFCPLLQIQTRINLKLIHSLFIGTQFSIRVVPAELHRVIFTKKFMCDHTHKRYAQAIRTKSISNSHEQLIHSKMHLHVKRITE